MIYTQSYLGINSTQDIIMIAKAIANRLKNVIPRLVNKDQTGFLKGRFNGENIRLIDSIMVMVIFYIDIFKCALQVSDV